MKSGIGDDFSDRKVRATFVAGMPREVQTLRLLVEMSHPQTFARWIGVGEAAGKECPGGAEVV